MARTMRKHATPAEARLWQALRSRRLGVKFRRQMPIGPYIADFACCAIRLIVEVDGDHHDGSETDPGRDAWLHDQGWRVLRFRNAAVLQELDGVMAEISSAGYKQEAPSWPPPQAGEGLLIKLSTPSA
jgi:very-short-patch-repair endonuclease